MARRFEDLGIDMSTASAQAGGNYRTLCPNCSAARKPEHRREKCLSVNPAKGVFHCFNCDWRGVLDGVDWRDMITEYSDPLGLSHDAPDDEGERYFKHRGISRETLSGMKVVSGAGVIYFPYYLHGRHINTKHRMVRKKKMRMDKGARLSWWNVDAVQNASAVVIVEGEIDLLTLVEAGVYNVISLPNGAQTGSMSFFNDVDWDAVGKVFLAGDMDEPGEKCMDECAARIGKEKCWRVHWPMNDANATLMEYGVDEIHRCLVNATPYPIEGIEQPGDESVVERVLKLYRDGMPRGLSTGWEALDEGYTITTGILDIWGGYPGNGKSELMDGLFINLGVMHDWRMAMYSPENYPTEFHIEKLARKFVNKPFAEGPTERMSEEELLDAIGWLDQHIHFMRPDVPTIDEILRLAKIEKRRFGINAFSIDPWNTLIHATEDGESGSDYIGRQLSKIRQFIRGHDVRGIVAAHPRKPERGAGALVPGPNDAAGSYNFFAMADAMIAVGRNKADTSQPVEMHIQKIRHRHLGKEGVCKFEWSPVTGRYTALEFTTGGLIL